jgi:hypothetical protein
VGHCAAAECLGLSAAAAACQPNLSQFSVCRTYPLAGFITEINPGLSVGQSVGQIGKQNVLKL